MFAPSVVAVTVITSWPALSYTLHWLRSSAELAAGRMADSAVSVCAAALLASVCSAVLPSSVA